MTSHREDDQLQYLSRVSMSGTTSDKEYKEYDTLNPLSDHTYSITDLKWWGLYDQGGNEGASGDQLLRSAEVYWTTKDPNAAQGFIPNGALNGVLNTLWGGSQPRSSITPDFVYLPGSAGNFIKTPADTKYLVTSSLSVRVQVILNDFDATNQILIGSDPAVARNWDFANKARNLQLVWNTAAGIQVADSTAKFPIPPAGVPVWIGFLLNKTANTLQFYYGMDETTLTPVGATLSVNANIIININPEYLIGTWNGWQYFAPGKYYQAKIICNGVLRGHFRASDINPDAKSGQAPTNEFWYVMSQESTNDPKYLEYKGQKYIYFPPHSGGTFNYLEKADSSSIVSLTGDIDIRARIDRVDLGAQTVFMEYMGDFVTSGWTFLTSDDKLRFAAATNPTGWSDYYSISCPIKPWYRVTRVAASGLIAFYWSNDGLSWTKVNEYAAFPGPLKTLLANPIRICNASEGVKYYSVEVRNGLNGPIVEKWSADAFNGFTLSRHTTGLKNVFVESQSCMLLGVDDFMVASANSSAWNFSPSESFSVVLCARLWSPERAMFLQATGNPGPGNAAGYGMYATPPGAGAFRLSADATYQDVLTPSASGQVIVLTGVRDRQADKHRIYLNKALQQEAPDPFIGAPQSTPLDLQLGREPNGTYADMEFYALAVFKSALSQEGINAIVDNLLGVS